MRNSLHWAVFILAATALHAQTTVDSSGNSMLKGAYRFRQVAILNVDANGNPTEMEAAYGVITFDGEMSYSLSGTYLDNTISAGAPQTFAPATGTYAIGANGLGYISSPLFPSGHLIFGSVGQGVFAGSDTEEGNVNDILIAIPMGATPANGAFTTPYTVGLLDFAGANVTAIKNAFFNLNPNGQGGFSSISVTGQAANQTGASLSQAVTGATYNFASNGNATLNVPLASGVSSANALFTGVKSMYVSGDGNFVLGWTDTGYDIFFGVSALSNSAANATYQGTYYLAALEDSPIAGSGPDSYYGSSLAALGDGNEIVHQRLSYFGYYAEDFVTADITQINSNGSTSIPDYNGYLYAFGDGGKAFVATGTGGTYTLLVGTQAPVLSGTGVFLNPTGIFNAASYAPITAGVSPGELLTLFGTGLSSSTLSATGGQAFPNMLGGVSVSMNGLPAAIYAVSPTQISTIVPYALSPGPSQFLDTIQVNNNGTLSNEVTVYLTDSLPGVFTQTQTGLGYGAVLHANGSEVTVNNPAVPGEYLEIFLTGLGTVTPGILDGAIGPTSALSYADLFTSKNLTVNFLSRSNGSSLPGNITFAGLAPGLAGLYQLNVQLPAGASSGDMYVEIITDFADVNQMKIPVGGATQTPATPQTVRPHRPARGVRRSSKLLVPGSN